MIERKIIIGLITNTKYLREIQTEWKQDYIESPTAKLIAGWCWEYFNKYKKAPQKEIEIIYIRKLKRGIGKELAEEIEEDILPMLSEEYVDSKEAITIDALLDETRQYFIERQIRIHEENISALLEKGKIEEAEKAIDNFRLEKHIEDDSLDLCDPSVLDAIDVAFDTEYQSIVSFPGALGDFWNEFLVRGGFVALQGPEKRGKTYWLLEFLMRAHRQGKKVAFFQAGDMTKSQQLIRICIYLAQKSNNIKYCGTQYVPVLDCIKNQADTCNKRIRECNHGIYTMDENEIREKTNLPELIKANKEFPNYRNCYNCAEFSKNKWGTVWIKKVDIENPLSKYESKRLVRKFFIETKNNVKISTHANGTLTISGMDAQLNKWEKKGFKPDIIILDYVDLLEPEKGTDFRHKENEKWKSLRRMSEERDCLVLTATQTDSESYEKDTIGLRNFSEDKRKYGHATAFFGLNQDKKGREKRLGIMRINKIVVREGSSYSDEFVHVIHRLEIGRPFLGSFY
jgi:hypothetical protein